MNSYCNTTNSGLLKNVYAGQNGKQKENTAMLAALKKKRDSLKGG